MPPPGDDLTLPPENRYNILMISIECIETYPKGKCLVPRQLWTSDFVLFSTPMTIQESCDNATRESAEKLMAAMLNFSESGITFLLFPFATFLRLPTCYLLNAEKFVVGFGKFYLTLYIHNYDLNTSEIFYASIQSSIFQECPFYFSRPHHFTCPYMHENTKEIETLYELCN